MRVRTLSSALGIAALLLFCTSSSFSCEWDNLIWIPRTSSADPLFRFIKDNKVGYIDATGNVVMPPTPLYEHGSHEGFGNNFGGEFHDGLLEIGASDGVYVDRSGTRTINKKFYRGWDFSEGLAAAMQHEGGKWGFINTKGEFAISPRFASSATDYIHLFEGGFALIEVGGRYGYIDHTGEFVIPPRFLMAYPFHEGFAAVVTDGPCTYSGIGTCSSFAVVPRDSMSNQPVPSCKWTYVDTSGRVVSDKRYDYAKQFSEGLAPVRVGKLWGYVDETGEIVIPPTFESAEGFSDGLALVSQNDRFGYIDRSGVFAISPQFEYAEEFSEGKAVVGDGKARFWFIDRFGKQALSGRFVLASSFFKGLSHVKLMSGDFAYIDGSGKTVFSYHP